MFLWAHVLKGLVLKPGLLLILASTMWRLRCCCFWCVSWLMKLCFRISFFFFFNSKEGSDSWIVNVSLFRKESLEAIGFIRRFCFQAWGQDHPTPVSFLGISFFNGMEESSIHLKLEVLWLPRDRNLNFFQGGISFVSCLPPFLSFSLFSYLPVLTKWLWNLKKAGEVLCFCGCT